MKVGILGTTPQAEAIARLLADGGEDLIFSDPRDPARAAELAMRIGTGISDVPYHQAIESDVLVLAVPWSELDRALAALGPLHGKIVIDAMVPTGPVHSSGAELLAKKLDSRHVVEAFMEPIQARSEIRICADDPLAKATVAGLIAACGCTPVDAGSLSGAGELERHFVRAA